MHIDFSDFWIYNLTENHMKVGARILKTGNICKFTEKVLSETLAVSCFVLECNPEVMIRPRCVNGYMAILITRGEGILRFDGHSVDVGSGTLVFALNGEEISADIEEWYTVTQKIRDVVTAEFFASPDYLTMTDGERFDAVRMQVERIDKGLADFGDYVGGLFRRYLVDRPRLSEYINAVKQLMKK
jgi:hypothetical protein